MEVLQRTANRGSISTGYDIENSLKTQANAGNEWFYRSSPTTGNKRTFTFSFWIKRTQLTGFEADPYLMSQGTNARFHFAGDALRFMFDGSTTELEASGVLRDTSAWYHIVWKSDITNVTAANRWQIYVNGVEITAKDIDYGTPPTNFFTLMNTTYSAKIGYNTDGSNGSSQYMAETHLIDGQALEPTEFGEFDEDTGIWKPKAYTGSYGTNGFYLDFENASSLGADSSGNGNNFTLNNIAAADQATDTPTNNFATGNNLHYFSNPTTLILTEGQTKIAKTANGWETLASTIAVTSGKWYMEMQNISVPESAMMSVFPADIEFIGAGGQINNYAGKVSGDGGISYYSYNGNIYQNASNASYGSAWANETNTMAIALDMDNGKVYFARANVWQNSGDPTSGATGTGAIDLIEPSKPHMMGYAIYANNTSGAVNFGGYTPSSISSAASDANGYGTFEYAPPSGYYALCTKNLEEFG